MIVAPTTKEFHDLYMRYECRPMNELKYIAGKVKIISRLVLSIIIAKAYPIYIYKWGQQL